MSTTVTTPPATSRTAGRLGFWLGIAATFVGIAVYMVQFMVLKQLGSTPWYAPVLATIGAALVFLSVRESRTVPRLVGLVVLLLLAGLQWYFFLSFTKLPQYAGPSAGEKLPPFQTTLATGGPFSTADLANGTPTVLIFFRGRW
jgi:hypothetical protein